MTKIAGKSGFVGVGDAASRVAGINTWSLDYTVDMLDSTDFSASGVSTFIPGKSQWSGTFSGYKDGVPISLGTVSSVSVFLAESQTIYWTGVAWISGIHPGVNFDGVVAVNYDFQGNGALVSASA